MTAAATGTDDVVAGGGNADSCAARPAAATSACRSVRTAWAGPRTFSTVDQPAIAHPAGGRIVRCEPGPVPSPDVRRSRTPPRRAGPSPDSCPAAQAGIDIDALRPGRPRMQEH